MMSRLNDKHISWQLPAPTLLDRLAYVFTKRRRKLLVPATTDSPLLQAKCSIQLQARRESWMRFVLCLPPPRGWSSIEHPDL